MRARQQTSTNKAAYRCSQYDQIQAQAKRDAEARAKELKKWAQPIIQWIDIRNEHIIDGDDDRCDDDADDDGVLS